MSVRPMNPVAPVMRIMERIIADENLLVLEETKSPDYQDSVALTAKRSNPTSEVFAK